MIRSRPSNLDDAPTGASIRLSKLREGIELATGLVVPRAELLAAVTAMGWRTEPVPGRKTDRVLLT